MGGGGKSQIERVRDEANAALAVKISEQQQQQKIIDDEKKRQAQEASDKAAAMDLSAALAKQKGFAAKARGKSGTLLTGSLGVVDNQSGSADQAVGTKTLLGM